MTQQNLNLDLDAEALEEESEVEKVSYQEILADALAAEDAGLIITISKDSLAIVQKGIMNAKSAARKRAHKKEIPWDAVTLRFEVIEDESDPDWIDLKIFATRRATILIRKKPVSRKGLTTIDLSNE